MVIVYVRHYLNDKGLQYFENEWLPNKVEPVISIQPGFVGIEWYVDEKESYGHVTVKFQDEKTLEDWIKKPEHDVVDLLDPYRVKTYWEAARTTDESARLDSAKLDWVKIEAKHEGSNF